MAITVEKCCWRHSLKTGTIIIGIVCGLVALAGLVFSVMKAAKPLMTREAAKKLNVNEEARQEKNKMTAASRYGGIVVGILMGLQLILCIMLVYGASNENPRLLKPWIIFFILSITISSIVYAILTILAFVYANALSGFAVLIFSTVYICLSVYFIIVVNSFYLELKG